MSLRKSLIEEISIPWRWTQNVLQPDGANKLWIGLKMETSGCFRKSSQIVINFIRWRLAGTSIFLPATSQNLLTNKLCIGILEKNRPAKT